MRQTILLIRNAAATDFGGAETYQVSLAGVLLQNQLHPIIVTRSKALQRHAAGHGIDCKSGWWWSRQDWSGKKVALVPLYILWQVILTAWYVRLIMCTKAGVLHIQSKDDFIAATVAGRIMRKRVVWTDHMDLRYIFQNIARPLRNPVGKLVFWAGRYAHHIILISDNEYRLVTAQFKRAQALHQQITIVKNGVIDQKQKYRAVKQGGFSFCLASRIVANKGIGEAIQAFGQFKAGLAKGAGQNPAANGHVRLDIYGDGPQLDTFKLRARTNPDIVFHGHQPDVLQQICNADVFMLPSYQEGFSIALLEATMLQKAIITTDVDSNPEIIRNGNTGLLVRPRDPADLARAMRLLYDTPALRRRLSQQARRQYEASFDLANSVRQQIIPLYKD